MQSARSGTMPAAVYVGDKTIEIREIPVPDVGPGDVLLSISHCGICGTDLHMVLEGWGRPDSVGGHEYSGTVVALGPDVDRWKVGDRVVGGPHPGCGECRCCRRGQANLCANRDKAGVTPFTGAFAKFKLNRSDSLYKVPDGLDLRTAALAEPAAVALRGVKRANVTADDRVLLTGAGPIGLLTIACLRATGAGEIVVSEPNANRRALALRAGASAVLVPDALESPAMPMDVVASPFQVVFECSGHAAAMEAALANLDRGGTLVLSGAGMGRPRLDPNRIILNELHLTGTYEYSAEDYADTLALLADDRLCAATIVEPEDQPLDRLQWAIEALAVGDIAGKVMVAPDA